MRTCPKCGERKAEDEFRRHKGGRRHSHCRACMATWKRARSPEVKRRERQAWRERNREKVRAHKAVAKAVARGTLIRPDECEGCGTVGPVQAHHKDYARRFDVRWLCANCHADEHLRVA